MSAHGKTCLSADHPLPAKELLVVKALDEFAHATHSAVLVRGVTVTVTVTLRTVTVTQVHRCLFKFSKPWHQLLGSTILSKLAFATILLARRSAYLPAKELLQMLATHKHVSTKGKWSKATRKQR